MFSCGHCMQMPLAKEYVCCKETRVLLVLMKNDEVECITDHPGFEPATQVHILQTTREMVLSSCSLKEIRDRFPSPQEVYVGFKEAELD